MSDTRSKKKGKKESSEKKGKTTSTSAGTTTSLSSSLIWLPVVISIGIYVYLNPQYFWDFLDTWVGFSEHYDGAPATHHQVDKSYIQADLEKRDAVVQAFKHSWDAYENNAMGADEYHPISQMGSNLTKAGGIGYMVVDVLDTLQIMGLDDEYHRARNWVSEKLIFDRDDKFSTFETTIRVLGGLLSAYHLSGNDPLYLEKAKELADRMLPAFETSSGIPLPLVNLAEQKGYETADFPGLTSVAEIGTLQLEFKYLAQLTENTEYWRPVERVMQKIKDARLPSGLASIFLMIENGHFYTSAIRLGSRGDSYYEYLLKQYIQTNASEPTYKAMYEDAMDAIHQYLIQKSMGKEMIYTSEIIPENGPENELQWRLTPKQDHLVCFLGGSLMLGAVRTGAKTNHVSVPPKPEELTEKGYRDWKTGAALIQTCMHTHDTATGLSPEIVYFRVPSDGMEALPGAPQDWYIKGADVGKFPPYDARYMLRPETIESLFIAYRLTGEQRYRDHAWNIFQSIEKHCKVAKGGYATVVNVDENPARQEDKMETFFLSETLKYLYLIFSSSDVIPLDKYVFNTEAHPLPIFDSIIRPEIM